VTSLLARIWRALGLAVVPRAWRANVDRDLADEAQRVGRSDWWVGTQMLAAGVRLRRIITGDVFMTDLRYAIRSLLRARWFTVGAALTFALGIGLNVAVFRVVDRMLYRPLPYRDAASLVLIRDCEPTAKSCSFSFPAAVVGEAHAGRLSTIADVGAAYGLTAVRTSADPLGDARWRLVGVSANVLSVLGVSPFIGRDLSGEEKGSTNLFAWLSYESWQTRFGSDRDVVGRPLPAQGPPIVVVGVLPKGFLPPAWAGLPARWDGLVTDRKSWASLAPSGGAVGPIGRLRPGATIDDARQELARVAVSLGVAERGGRRSYMRVDPLAKSLFGQYGAYLRLIAVAAALILILGCVNLAALQLVRTRSRERLYAVQAALGASRRRILAANLIESIVLSAGGMAIAFVVNVIGSGWILSRLPPVFSGNSAALAEPRVLLYAVLLAVASAAISGFWPSWRASRVDLRGVIQADTHGAGRRQVTSGRVLLTLEAAFGCLLLLGAGLALRSLYRMTTEEIGINPRDLYTINFVPASAVPAVPPAGSNLDELRRKVDALRSVPGIVAAEGGEFSPLDGLAPPRPVAPNVRAGLFQVSDSTFQTYGMSFLAGRPFTEEEARTHVPVAVISAAAGVVMFGGQRPAEIVGRAWTSPDGMAWQIVGVVADARGYFGDGFAMPAAMYVPLGMMPTRFLGNFAFRTANGVVPSAEILSAAVSRTGPPQRAVVTPARASLDPSIREPRFRAELLGVLGVTGLLLLGVGLYAMTMYEVSARRRELGVRLSLGANPAQIQREVIVQAAWPVLVGGLLGLLLGFSLMTFGQQFLYRVDGRDLKTHFAVLVALTAFAAFVAWLPARRAAGTDPSVVLRAT
jgi:predicted permease